MVQSLLFRRLNNVANDKRKLELCNCLDAFLFNYFNFGFETYSNITSMKLYSSFGIRVKARDVLASHDVNIEHKSKSFQKPVSARKRFEIS